MMSPGEFKVWFDVHLFHILEEKIVALCGYSNTQSVHELVRYSRAIAADGKRMRPYMAAVGYLSLNKEGDPSDILHFLVGLELFHLFALVHDDIIDGAEMRHSVRSTHALFAERYENVHTGISLAVLLGDALMAWSYECVEYTCSRQQEKGALAREEFATLVTEVIHGQMIDVLCTTHPRASYESIIEKMRLKSAQYSFYRPLHAGMILAGKTARDTAFAKEYAQNLGIAFQIQDDLLDCSMTTSKSRFGDIRSGQHTILSWYMQECAEENYHDAFLRYFGMPFDREEEERVETVLRQAGAVSYALEIANQYFLKAQQAISTYDRANNPVWKHIIETVESRKK